MKYLITLILGLLWFSATSQTSKHLDILKDSKVVSSVKIGDFVRLNYDNAGNTQYTAGTVHSVSVDTLQLAEENAFFQVAIADILAINKTSKILKKSALHRSSILTNGLIGLASAVAVRNTSKSFGTRVLFAAGVGAASGGLLYLINRAVFPKQLRRFTRKQYRFLVSK